MRPTPALAGLLAMLALPCAAKAEEAGNASTRAALAVTKEGQPRTFQYPGDVDWFRLKLVKGSDYYITGMCECSFDIRDTAGKVLASGHGSDVGQSYHGFPFHAPYTGLYFVEFTDTGALDPSFYPYGYTAVVEGDCPATEGHCGLMLGVPRAGTLADDYDVDGFQVALEGGHAYALTLDHGSDDYMWIDVTDPVGNVIQSFFWSIGGTFTAPTGGVYTISVTTDEGHEFGDPYTLTIAEVGAARKGR